MDLGLEVKQLKDLLNVDENSITGWELRGVTPTRDYLRRVVEFIDENQPEPIPRKLMWSLCFAKNRLYPKETKTFGNHLRATRMENFMSIRQLAKKLGVNECTVAKWELEGRQPRPDMMEPIRNFLDTFGSGTS